MLSATREAMTNRQKHHFVPENFYSSDSSSSSEEELEEELSLQENQVKRSMMRYGRPITSQTMKVSFIVKILALAAAMIVIPLELVLRNVVIEAERSFIVSFQTALHQSFFKYMSVVIVFFGEVLFVEACAVFIYLFADPLIGFKISLVTFFGVFMIAFIKLIYQIPRPFWRFDDIIAKRCNFDFSGPSDHAFLSTFFYAYTILIFAKYSESRFTRFRNMYLSLNGLFVILVAFSMNYLGNTFLFEGLIGIIYGLLYCIICFSLDSEIHSFCEKTAFIIKSTRKYKFKLFLITLIMFVAVLIIFNAFLNSFSINHEWVLNSLDDCEKESTFESRMGIDYTFNDSAVVFSIIGAGFGASTATTTIDNILWSETVLWKRL